MQKSNQARQQNFPAQYDKNPAAFVQAEKERIENFQYQYKISKAVATVCFIITLLIFWFNKTPTWQGAVVGFKLFLLWLVWWWIISPKSAHAFIIKLFWLR